MATSKATKRKRAGIHVTGDKGRNRVRAYPRSGTYFVEFYEGKKRERLSLGRISFDEARKKADEIAAELLKDEGTPVGELTLKALFDKYLREVTPQYGSSKQYHDKL